MNTSKLYNNNQMIDDLVHGLKMLSLDTVIKDEELADSKETISSLKESDIYMACVNGGYSLTMFNTLPMHVLKDAGISNDDVFFFSRNPDKIPEEYYNRIRDHMSRYVIDNYVEENDYYRTLNGLPDLGDPGIKLERYINGVDNSKYVHEMDDGEIHILESTGELDILKDIHPDKKYLNRLGKRKISIHKARGASRFELIYCPEIENTKLYNKYLSTFDKVRVYTLKTIYSDAFKFGSDYYDNFICIFMIVQTITDIVINIPEDIIKREFYDEQSIRDMFLSHGIDYFPEIPLRYQISMIKNLNTLLKFKSTTRNLVDICSIFGFENVSLFKYYLLKDRRIGGDGKYTKPEYITGEDGKLKEDVLKMYDLKFLKVPIDKNPDDYIRDRSNHIGYKEIVNTDEYWYGGNSDELATDRAILEKNFNYIHSKYLSIDNVYEMNKISFDMTYFINMVFDNRDLEENLQLPVQDIEVGRRFKLTDIICTLYTLMYERIGIKDTIIDTTTKAMSVLGFNYEVNLSQLATYLNEKGYTFEDVGIDKFIIPNTNIMTYNELMDIYATNKDIHDHITDQMFYADDINIYRIYKTIYESLMVSKLNTQNFTTDGQFSRTYTEYLRGRDTVLYNTILNVRALSGEEKVNKILGLIDAILLNLQQYVDSVDLNFFMSNISTMSGELIKEYLYKLINFFKSYTVQMLSANMSYTFDSKIDHKLFLFDNLQINTTYYLSSQYRYDFLMDTITFGDKEIVKNTNYRLQDNMFITRTTN